MLVRYLENAVSTCVMVVGYLQLRLPLPPPEMTITWSLAEKRSETSILRVVSILLVLEVFVEKLREFVVGRRLPCHSI